MNKNRLLNNLQPADRIVMPKSNLNLVQHHIIYLGKDKKGNRVFIENSISKGVQIVNEAQVFKDGYQITRIEKFNGTPQQRNEAIQRALKLIGKNYNLINFNCEHFANIVQYKSIESKQVQLGTGLGLGLIALIIGIFANNE